MQPVLCLGCKDADQRETRASVGVRRDRELLVIIKPAHVTEHEEVGGVLSMIIPN
jgi:hypothetical protein